MCGCAVLMVYTQRKSRVSKGQRGIRYQNKTRACSSENTDIVGNTPLLFLNSGMQTCTQQRVKYIYKKDLNP